VRHRPTWQLAAPRKVRFTQESVHGAPFFFPTSMNVLISRLAFDAVATEPSRVRIFPKAMVLNALRTDPESAMSFLADMAHQVIELRQRVELMKVRSAKERLMLYLDSNAGPDGRTVKLRGQLQDIASDLGLTREALYRTLASLERAGAIERADGRILLKKSVSPH
jgi:CRP-like cAMP-binding protein